MIKFEIIIYATSILADFFYQFLQDLWYFQVPIKYLENLKSPRNYIGSVLNIGFLHPLQGFAIQRGVLIVGILRIVQYQINRRSFVVRARG